MKRTLQALSLAIGIAALGVVLMVFVIRLEPSAQEIEQANILIKSVQPLVNGTGQSVYGAPGYRGIRVEVYGVVDKGGQDTVLARLQSELSRGALRQRVSVRFYRQMQLREVTKKNGWTERTVVKTELLREVNLP
jgi:hypothetical protein